LDTPSYSAALGVHSVQICLHEKQNINVSAVDSSINMSLQVCNVANYCGVNFSLSVIWGERKITFCVLFDVFGDLEISCWWYIAPWR